MHIASPQVFAFRQDESPEKLVVEPSLKGTESVLKACRDFKLKKCIFTSSLNNLFSGNKLQSMYTDEDWGNETSENMAIQDKSKILTEKKIWEFHKDLSGNSDLELMTVLPGMMIGKPNNSRTHSVQ